eukprot:scaffold113140_cov18-Tisochrysis_lutea.AAC.1
MEEEKVRVRVPQRAELRTREHQRRRPKPKPKPQMEGEVARDPMIQNFVLLLVFDLPDSPPAARREREKGES